MTEATALELKDLFFRIKQFYYGVGDRNESVTETTAGEASEYIAALRAAEVTLTAPDAEAARPLPADADYEDYAQIENGVGMITSLLSEFDREMEFLDEYLADYTAPRRVSVATGVAAYPTIRAMAARLEAAVEGLEIHVYEIINHFFGETITVAGLLTGQDIAAQLEGRELGDELIFPCNALRAGETVFLDDMTTEELSSRLGVPTRPGSNDGATFISELLGVDSPVS